MYCNFVSCFGQDFVLFCGVPVSSCGIADFNKTFRPFTGCTTASIFILITGYASTPAMAVAFLTIGVGITGLNASGYAVNILDIAPQYAGVIMGVTNVFGSAPGFISPQIVGILTPNKVNEFELVPSSFAIPQFFQLWLPSAVGFVNHTIIINS